MSEEKSYEVEANLEEACTDEECEGCGEVHPPVDLEKLLRKQIWVYRATVAGYFGSLLACTFCAYQLAGIWAGAGIVSAFGVYFFHLNMNAIIRVLMTMEQALYGREQEPKHTGQYL